MKCDHASLNYVLFLSLCPSEEKNKQTGEKLLTQVPGISGEIFYADTSHLYYKMSWDPIML